MTTVETLQEGHDQARQPHQGQVQGRTARVTGGTGGIDAAICRELADQGAHVAAGYWRDDEDMEKFLASMAADYPGRRITVHEGNLARDDDGRRALAGAIEQHGRVDILVNNAGIPEKVLDRLRAQIPVGRLGAPGEMARVVCFLAADASSYITGQIWAVNGGLGIEEA